MTYLDHINSLASHGACIKADDQRIPLTEAFYRKAVEECKSGGYNAITYDLVLPEVEEDLAICIWSTGRVDSGSMKNICACLEAF